MASTSQASISRRFFIALLVVLGMAGAVVPAAAQTPTPLPETPPVQVQLTGRAVPDTLIGGERTRLEFTLSVTREPDTICYGIPRDPLDLIFVVDNSGSAGRGPGSNLALTRQWLESFISFAAQQMPVGSPPSRSRIGLAASRVAESGTEILWQNLTEDYTALYTILEDLPGGGDTELAAGIRQAKIAFEQRARPTARQVLVLMLHDRLPLNDSTFAALSEVRQASIDVYLFANSLNVAADQAIDAALAQPITGEEFFLLDPPVEDLRYVFVEMSGGSMEVLAQDIALMMLATPDGLQDPKVSSSGSAITNTVSWGVPQLAAQENAALTYEGEVGSLSARQGQMNLTAQIAYLDCNGYPRSQTAALVFRAQEPQNTPTPAATTVTEMPPTPLPTPTPPEDGSDSCDFFEWLEGIFSSEFGPIDQLLNWLGGIIPAGISSSLASLVGGVPIFLQWVLLVILVLVLLYLLWRLFKMLKRLFGRKKSSPLPSSPSLPPSSPRPVSPTLPQWISALPGNVLLRQVSGARAIATTTPHPLQDTLLIGLGPAGREVLAQVAAGLHDRFGAATPEQIRLVQVDVLPVGVANQLAPPLGLRDEQWALLRPDFADVSDALRKDPQAFGHWQWYEAAAADDGRARGRMALFYDVKSGGENSVLWQALRLALQGLNSPVIRIIGTTFDDVSSGMLVDMARLTQLAVTGDSNGNVDVQLWLAGPVGCDWGDRLSGYSRVRSDEQLPRTLVTLRELERFQRNAPVEFRYVPDTNRQDVFRATRQYALINKIVLFEPLLSPTVAPESDTLACMADTLLALFNQEPNSVWNAHLDNNRTRMGDLANDEGKGAVLAIGSHALRYPGGALAQVMAWRMVREVLFETGLGLFPLEKLDHVRGTYKSLPESECGRPLDSTLGPHPEAVEKLVFDFKGHWDTPNFAAAVRTRVNALLNGEVDAGEPLVVRRAGLAQAIRWLKLLRGVLLQNNAVAVAQKVRALEKDLDAWQRWFREEVHPLCQQQFEAARTQLEALRDQPARNWGLDAALDWNLYRRHIRTWITEPGGNVQSEPLLRLAARFGWEVEINDAGWRSRLIVPPGDFAEPVDPGTLDLLRPYELAGPPSNPRILLQEVFSLAERLSSISTQTSLLDVALNQDFPAWLAHADLRLTYNESMAETRIGMSYLTLLVAPESSSRTPQLEQHIRSVPDIPGKFVSCQTNDPTAITLLRATSWLPLSTLALYNEDAWNENLTLPALYVWRPEQIAAELERDRRLSALWVSRIAENEPLLRAFGLAFIYGAVTQELRGWHIPGVAEMIPGALSAVLDAVFDRDVRLQVRYLAALQKAVEERRLAIVDRRAYLRQAAVERVSPLEQGDARMQDLGVYLHGLIAMETR
ncbi:MAG: VWA domain-containing protein [Anaerolineae bacterium]|nr:VWA domain-containing protein [Anaerolineae bacterium]